MILGHHRLFAVLSLGGKTLRPNYYVRSPQYDLYVPLTDSIWIFSLDSISFHPKILFHC
jgi:hypothetical protein